MQWIPTSSASLGPARCRNVQRGVDHSYRLSCTKEGRSQAQQRCVVVGFINFPGTGTKRPFERATCFRSLLDVLGLDGIRPLGNAVIVWRRDLPPIAPIDFVPLYWEGL
jgi:hypothetical protein